MPNDIKRQKSYPACGRLIVLENRGGRGISIAGNEQYDGFDAINFPSMPEVIELARNPDYLVTTNPAFPDGVHQYRGTQPLEIPISFDLSMHDSEYCPKGAYTVLRVAAELHALTLPFAPEDLLIQVAPAEDATQPVPGSQTEAGKAHAAASNSDFQLAGSTDRASAIYPPATCYLELMLTDKNDLGVACVGYVKNVSVKLYGPFLRGPGISANLPSRGQFSFTFVHSPNYTNATSIVDRSTRTIRQAYAQTVKDRLYNTVGLLTNPNAATGEDIPQTYKGFN